MRHGDPMPHEADLPPLAPMSSAVMADAQAEIAETYRPSLLARVFMAQVDRASMRVFVTPLVEAAIAAHDEKRTT